MEPQKPLGFGRGLHLRQRYLEMYPQTAPQPALATLPLPPPELINPKFYQIPNIPERFKTLRKSEDLDFKPNERIIHNHGVHLRTNCYEISKIGALALHIYYLTFDESIKKPKERVHLVNQLRIYQPQKTYYTGYGLLFAKTAPDEKSKSGEQIVRTETNVQTTVKWKYHDVIGEKPAYVSDEESATHLTILNEGILKNALVQTGLQRMDGAYYDFKGTKNLPLKDIPKSAPQFQAVPGIHPDIELRQHGMLMSVELKTKFIAKDTLAEVIDYFKKDHNYGSPQHMAACEDNLLDKQLSPSYGSTRLYRIKEFTTEVISFVVRTKEGSKECDPYTYLQYVSVKLRTRQPE